MAIKEHCKRGYIAYDIGAHTGFYTLLFSRLVGSSGYVYAFEPNFQNLVYLYKHLQINNIKNVKVLPIGIYCNQDYKYFCKLKSSTMGYISKKEEQILVPVDSIDNLLFEKAGVILPPNIVKIDVEGAELYVIEGMVNTIRKHKPVVLVALDDFSNKKLVYELLYGMKYSIYTLDNLKHEIVAIPP